MKTNRSWVCRGHFLVLSVVILWCGAKAFAQASNTVPVVTVQATQPFATATSPGVFTVFRTGNTNLALNVWYDLGGSASNGVDYVLIPPSTVSIAAGAISNTIVITPTTNAPVNVLKSVELKLAPSPAAVITYIIGSPSSAVVYLTGGGTNFLPALSITSPNNGAEFYTPTSVPITATVGYFDQLPPTNVEFYAGTNDLSRGIIGISSGFSGSFFLTWTNPPPGNYPLTAVASFAPLSVTSAPVNISVLPGGTNTMPVVTVLATQPLATPANPGVFTVFRAGDTNLALNVWYDLGGSASNGVDYAMIPQHLLAIAAGATSNTIIIAPATNSVGALKTVVLNLTNSPMMPPINYLIGSPSAAVVYLAGGIPPLPPRITSPKNGEVFYLPTNIATIASVGYFDYLSPTNVEFYAGTNDLGRGIIGISSGFNGSFFLTWTNPPPGNYPLTAVASYGNVSLSTTSAPVNITVLPGTVTNLPPLVHIFSPSNGAVFYTPTNVQIFAKASDPDGSVTNVEFFAGTNDLGPGNQVVLDPPGVNGVTGLVYLLNWRNPLPGNYPLTAVAADNRGASTVSAPVNIAVRQGPATNLPPVVRIVSPANGSVFRAPVNLPLFAFASDPNNFVTAVEFFAGTNSLGYGHSVTVAPPPTPPGPVQPPILLVVPTNYWLLIWTNPLPATNIVLTALATDAAGLSTTSAPVTISVLPPLPPPTNRPAIVNIVATDPIAIEGTNCWVWPGETNASPSWTNWPAAVCRFFTNCGPKTATFNVRRFGDTNASLTLSYQIGGTASNGVDYVALPGAVTIAAGERNALISVVPIDDGPPDVDKTVILALTPSTNAPPDYLLGLPRRAAAIILDGDGVHPLATMLPGGSFHLATPGPDAAWFFVEYSTDMFNWTPVCTNQVVNGSIDFVDPDAPGNPSRFYRAVPLAGPPAE